MTSSQVNTASKAASEASPTTSTEVPTESSSANTGIFTQLVEWSKDRPAWQRDALRRIVTQNNLVPKDLDELLKICKGAHGLADPQKSAPLEKAHVSITSQQTVPVFITGITHHAGVNALAPEQTIAFGSNLTIVYGENAAGKSGYTRILKRACRSRGIEEILGNVLNADAPAKPKATIRYRQGTAEIPLDWEPESKASDALGSVSVFDSHCAAVYLRDKTDVAFRPFGLDIFDKLSAACGDVRKRLEDELANINKVIPALPIVPENTKPRALIDNITALTNVDELRRLATVSSKEEQRAKDLREQRRDFESADPKKRARELGMKADRLDSVSGHLRLLSGALSDAKISQLRNLEGSVRAARVAVESLRQTALTPDLLPATGEATWRSMWGAIERFSKEAYPAHSFPVLTEGARCPFCQQTIEEEAANRLRHFAEYISSQSQVELQQAEAKYKDALAAITQLVTERKDIALAMDELAADDADLGKRAKDFLALCRETQNAIKEAGTKFSDLPQKGVPSNPEDGVREKIEDLRKRSAQMQQDSAAFDPKLSAELRELDARIGLRDGLKNVLDEIERKKRVGAYRDCLDETSTQAITKKSTELTKQLVTDNLRNTFQKELKGLEFTHLAVEVQAAGGAKGALFHRLAFSSAPNISVSSVLSEGESRTLSLAAFLTELSTASSKSGIIFDDPVSSLDHIWRERIARRLVAAAVERQVIVFTHDLLFLKTLLAEAEAQGVPCQHQYVRREGQSGICSPDLPWHAMSTKERIGKLRVRQQSLEKIQKTAGQEVYESTVREIYGLLREAWERAISEVLLNDVVERYRPSIQTQRLRFLHDITQADLDVVDKEMTECSRWIRGHDQAAADGTPVPGPGELKSQIDELERWAKEIRRRRGN